MARKVNAISPFNITALVLGMALMRDLRGTLTGLGQPTYVLDIPGGHGKVPVGPTYLTGSDGAYVVEDPNGHHHIYSDSR